MGSSVGEVLNSDPATAARGPVWGGVFWRGTDNAIWYKGWKNNWSASHSLGGTFTSGPAVAMMTTTRVDVFARGTDNALWHNIGSGTSESSSNWSWSGWENLGGVLTSDPAAVSWGPDRIDVFARGTDNGLSAHVVERQRLVRVGEPGRNPLLRSGSGFLGRSAASTCSCAVRPYSLWHKSYSGGTWSSWENLGGVITSDPDAVSLAPDRIHVFARGTDNGLLHTWWDGSAWRP